MAFGMIGIRPGRGVVVCGMLLLGVAIAAPARAQVGVVAGPIVNPANEHEYRARLDAGGWSERTVVTMDASGRACVEVTGVVGQGEGFFRLVVE